jgi:hypothetical protein
MGSRREGGELSFRERPAMVWGTSFAETKVKKKARRQKNHRKMAVGCNEHQVQVGFV